MISLGLPSRGRLFCESIEWVKASGIAFLKDTRSLSCKTQFPDLKLVFIHPKDCGLYVENGLIDIGISAADILVEYPANVRVLSRLNFATCRLVLLVPLGSSITKSSDIADRVIGTKYPIATKNWLKSVGTKAEIRVLHGAVEIAPALGICDAVIDSYQTGDTAKANDLIVIETILHSTAVLIGGHSNNKEQMDFYVSLLENAQT